MRNPKEARVKLTSQTQVNLRKALGTKGTSFGTPGESALIDEARNPLRNVCGVLEVIGSANDGVVLTQGGTAGSGRGP